jgi:hypothetical protein
MIVIGGNRSYVSIFEAAVLHGKIRQADDKVEEFSVTKDIKSNPCTWK